MTDPTQDGSSPALDIELSRALDRAKEIALELGPPPKDLAGLRLHLEQASRWWNEGGPELAEEHPITIDCDGDKVPAVLYRPVRDSGLPIYVYLHGGGFRFGSLKSNARQLRAIASAWGGAVISLAYPLLPDHPFPAAVSQTSAALRALSTQAATWGLDGQRIAVGGSSAGSNIALGAVVALGGCTQAPFVKAAALVTPVLDGNANTESMLRFGAGPHFPNRAATIETWQAYLGRPEHDTDARANLMLAEPGLFPPMFMAVAEIDVFRDGAFLMADRMRAAEQAPVLTLYPGMTHLFFGYSRMVQQAERCAADIAAFLAATLSPT